MLTRTKGITGLVLMVSQQILVGGEGVKVRARKGWGTFPGKHRSSLLWSAGLGQNDIIQNNAGLGQNDIIQNKESFLSIPAYQPRSQRS